MEWFGVEFLQKLESEGPSWSLIGGLGDPVGSKLKVREVKLALSWWLWSPRVPQVEPNTGPGVPKLGSRVQNLGPGAPKLDPKGDPKGVKMRPKRWQKVIQRGTRAPKNPCLHWGSKMGKVPSTTLAHTYWPLPWKHSIVIFLFVWKARAIYGHRRGFLGWWGWGTEDRE